VRRWEKAGKPGGLEAGKGKEGRGVGHSAWGKDKSSKLMAEKKSYKVYDKRQKV
jgi:hypothetical protein